MVGLLTDLMITQKSVRQKMPKGKVWYNIVQNCTDNTWGIDRAVRDEMLTRETIVNQLRENYPYLTAEYNVGRIGLFGSFARGTATETSDIDVVVEFQRPIGFKFIEFVDYLERLFGREVDVLTPAGLQGIRVSQVASNITESILYV